MGKLRAGNLDRRVAILRSGPAVDDGFTTRSSELRLVAWRRASVMPVRGSEALEHEQRRALAEVSVWLRFDTVSRAIRASDKLAIRGVVHELLAPPLEVGRGVGIELFAKALAGADTVDPGALAVWAG